jgi:crotonobetainyl-CoA:carnitine CoA-transferase CaiB-like acyl-CoA transferase
MSSRALSGLRVLNLAGGVAGGYCSKLMADLGADVILVEPPAGDPCRKLGPFPDDDVEDAERSGLFLYLHAGTRSLVADLAAPDDQALVARLAEGADVLLTAAQPEDLAQAGLDPERLRASNPRLVHVSITHFGVTGPYRRWQADEITDYAMGGWLYFGGEPEKTPLMVPGYQAQHCAGLHGALGALAALAERDHSGLGQFVDVSAVEAMAGAHPWTTVAWSHEGTVMRRTPSDLVRCADGWVHFVPVRPDLLALLIERPELMSDPRFVSPDGTFLDRQELMRLVAEWCAGQSMETVYRRGQELRAIVAPVYTVRDLAGSPQLTARVWFNTIEHALAGELTLPGAPYRLTGSPAFPSGPAPLLDEQGSEIRAHRWGATSGATTGAEVSANRTDRPSLTPPTWPISPDAERLPLAGLRVLELTANMIGPQTGRFLADLGAEVIKIESPRRPATRILYLAGGDPRSRPYNRSGYFNKHNRNKLGITLDLSVAAGREQFLRLLARTDVVIENNSARVLPNLGLGYEALRAVKPDIILCSMTGFGGSGPERDYVALGSSIEAAGGLAALTGYAGDPTPHRTGNFYADPVGAAHGAVAILAALRHRDRTGEGQWIDLSMLESALALFGEAFMDWSLNRRVPSPRGNRHPRFAPQGVYPSAGNDSWLALTVRDEHEWQGLCRAIGRADLAADPELAGAELRHAQHDALDEAIYAWSSSLDHYDAARRLQAEGVPAAPVLASWELFSDPHLHDRGFLVPVPHPETGVMPFPGFPWRLSRTPAAIRGGAPCFGEHNALVFRELLGLSDEAIADLYSQNVAGDEPLVTVRLASAAR